MKTIQITFPIAILTMVFGLNSCENKKVDTRYVKSALWQWDKGFKAGDGDFIDFATTNFNTISHDTIFRKGVPTCIVIETDKARYLMKIKSLTGEIGYYADSEEFTK